MRMRCVLLAFALLATLPPIGAEASSTAAAVRQACAALSSFDRDACGAPEIRELRVVGFRSGHGPGLVLILVEPRIWEPMAGAADLRPAIHRLADDIAREGGSAAVVTASLYDGPVHKDGQIVLALRDLLRRIRTAAPGLSAALLVGNFPNAFLVRQYYWQRDDGISVLAGTKAELSWPAVKHVRSLPEPVASPADIVLADLDGRWDALYRQGPERIAGLVAAFPEDPRGELSSAFEKRADRFEDFFLVPDGTWDEKPMPAGKVRFTFAGEPNVECAPADLTQANILARPDISIGRINALHAALQPDPAIRGADGGGLLDAQGRPRTVEFPTLAETPNPADLWQPSAVMERRLLREYLDRNHRFRTGGNRAGLLPATITTEWGSSVAEMKRDVAGWKDAPTDGLDVVGAAVTSADFVEWMKRPALARAVKAHANPMGYGFGAPADRDVLDRAVGGTAWWWSRQGAKLVPTLRDQGGWIGYGLIRSLYENHVLPATPSLYYHTGCECIMPAHYENLPYSSPRCGQFQAAETLLMLGGGLALVGRGKVFYDEPRDFWKAMGKGRTFGEAWGAYFGVEGADAEVAKDGIGRKRAYFWSVIGDCTLRLPASLLSAPPSKPRG